jgi:hypothetical protein
MEIYDLKINGIREPLGFELPYVTLSWKVRGTESKRAVKACLSIAADARFGDILYKKEGADLLFQLVSRRYERRSTIVTTNVGIGAWAKVFGDPVTASAIADRVCHHCHVIRITGRSYRMKDLLPDVPEEARAGARIGG